MSFTPLSDASRTARRAYRCELCGLAIPAGSRYRRRSYVLDGEMLDEKMHTWCRDELEWYLDAERPDDGFEWEWVREWAADELASYGYAKWLEAETLSATGTGGLVSR